MFQPRRYYSQYRDPTESEIRALIAEVQSWWTSEDEWHRAGCPNRHWTPQEYMDITFLVKRRRESDKDIDLQGGDNPV